MKIAFDMDGTLIDFWGYFEPIIFELTGNLARTDINDYDATAVFNISQETYIDIFREYKKDFYLNGNILPGVIEAFNQINKDVFDYDNCELEFCVITNRIGQEDLLWTEEWVKNRLLPHAFAKFDGVYLNQFRLGDGWKHSKVEMIKSVGAVAMVEDDPEQVQLCTQAGIPTFFVHNKFNKNIRPYSDKQKAPIYDILEYKYFPGMFESFKSSIKDPVG